MSNKHGDVYYTDYSKHETTTGTGNTQSVTIGTGITRVLQATDKEGNFVGDTTIEFNYEKALDKACELLSKNVTKRVHYVDEYGEFDNDEPVKTKEEWKDWLLRDK